MWEKIAGLVNRDGPVHVRRADGTGVAYGASGKLRASDPDLAQVWAARDVDLDLFDELSQLIRTIPGSAIIDAEQSSPGWVIVVDDTVEPEPGDTVSTRG